jgi:hypothetical protein
VDKHYAQMINPAVQKKPAAFLTQMTQDINSLLATGALPSGY